MLILPNPKQAARDNYIAFLGSDLSLRSQVCVLFLEFLAKGLSGVMDIEKRLKRKIIMT